MVEATWFFRILPYVSYIVGSIGAVVSGYLVYSGISTKLERRHFRLRLKDGWTESRKGFEEMATTSQSEMILKQARYPLGINALKLQFISLCLFAFVVLNYGLFSYVVKGHSQLVPIVVGGILILLLQPGFKFSLSRFLLGKLIEHRKARRNAELFSLYDMLVSEIEMMRTTRVNAYSLMRGLLPYFKELNPLITKMLADWSASSVGPHEAIENFAQDIGTSEAKSLATVLRTFDENSRMTLLTSLKGMEDMFITSQIENYRRKRKVFVDVISIPVKIAHFLILLNFVLVIIMMVMMVMDSSKLTM